MRRDMGRMLALHASSPPEGSPAHPHTDPYWMITRTLCVRSTASYLLRTVRTFLAGFIARRDGERIPSERLEQSSQDG